VDVRGYANLLIRTPRTRELANTAYVINGADFTDVSVCIVRRDRAAVGSSARGGTSSMDTVPGKQNGASDRGVTVRNLKE
jgi:hypothetical protein